MSLNQVAFFPFSLKSYRGWSSGSPEPIKSIKSAGNVWLNMYDARCRHYCVRLSRAENWYKPKKTLNSKQKRLLANLQSSSAIFKMLNIINTQIEIAASPEEVRNVASPLITPPRDPSLHPSQFSDLEH